MLSRKVRQRYRASSRGVQIWAEHFLQTIDGGLAWSTVNSLRPSSCSRHQWVERLDKVIRDLRPRQRNALYIEYLSPANTTKHKVQAWISVQGKMSGFYANITFHSSLEAALAVIEAYRPYWDPDYTRKDKERQKNAELHDKL